jgi:hypothetical protein
MDKPEKSKRALLQKEGSFEKLKLHYGITIEDITKISGCGGGGAAPDEIALIKKSEQLTKT